MNATLYPFMYLSRNKLPYIMKKLFKLSFLYFLTFLMACHQDNNDPINEINSGNQNNNNEFSSYFGNTTERTFLGTVMDKNHNPLEGVTITIENRNSAAQAQTDANGVFIISDAPVYTRFGYVKAEKDGYITGSRSVVPSVGTNKVTIILLDETSAGTVNSGSEETVSLVNGASVTLPGNYIDESGMAYSGSVNVVFHHLNPADEDMPSQMPGMLYAANSSNQERMLQTFGMLAVELLGSGGEKLNLADGSTAEIVMPLDAGLLATAPATIPLWYFNEDYGYWIEEGEAVLDGTNYVGTVSHFSFWNCDIPAEAVTLCVNVADEDGNNLTNQSISITSTTFGTTYGYTNEQGQVCGFVPSNEVLELNAYSYDMCGSAAIFTSSVGPFSSDSSIDIIIPDNPDLISETVTGTFNDCDDNPVTEGYISLSYGYHNFNDYITDGDFEINLIRCTSENTFGIEAVDFVNLQATDSLSYTFTTPITDLGTLTACNTIDEFIQYSIDDGVIEFIALNNINAIFNENDPQYSNNPTLNISGFGNGSTNNCFYLFGVLNPDPYVGSYDVLDWTISGDLGFNIQECIDMNVTNNNIVFNLNSLGNTGDYIDMNFSGDYEDFQGNTHSINGVIHVIRDN